MFQEDLFDCGPEVFHLQDSTLTLYRKFLCSERADYLFHAIKEKVNWEQSDINIAGRTIPIPRLNAWYADKDKDYSYSGIKLPRHDWLEELEEIRREIFDKCAQHFNSCLLNYYRDGNDSVSWHSDNEPELGHNPLIASVSFGVERKFTIRKLHNHQDKLTIVLPHSSLFIMEGALQHLYEHQVPKEKKISGGRLNLTFRNIKG